MAKPTLEELDFQYFELFGDSVDLWNLLQAISRDDVYARIERAIKEKKPIDYKKEFGYDPIADAEKGIVY